MIRPLEVSMRATFASALVIATTVLGAAAPALADGPVIEVPTVRIVGHPHRPNAFYVLERSAGRTEVVDLRTTFTGEIIRDAEGLDR